MLDYVVKKIVAKEDERIAIESSYDEMLKFTENEIRPDFVDTSIICIKFVICMGEYDDAPEQTDWYINPCHFKGVGSEYPYNLTMDCDFVPEILLLDVPTVYIKNKYMAFNATLLYTDGTENLSDEEKYGQFWSRHGKAIKEYRKRHSN